MCLAQEASWHIPTFLLRRGTRRSTRAFVEAEFTPEKPACQVCIPTLNNPFHPPCRNACGQLLVNRLGQFMNCHYQTLRPWHLTVST